MAFPTSSLTNNQVHKEGNRAFVYDSAIGVWDQVRETDRTENKIVQGEIGSSVTFPTGHVIGMWSNYRTDGLSVVTTNTGGTSTNTDGLVGVDTTNRLYVEELSVTVDVSSATSDLFVIGTIGVGNQTWSNKGAYGMVLNIPSPTTNYAYQTDNYPFYPAYTLSLIHI